MTEIQNNHQIQIQNEIWLVLSEFYLDTELTSDDFDRISTVFLNSGFSLKELKEIDLFEVFPLLQPNLFSVAGVWAGFDKVWLLAECEKRYNLKQNIFYRFKCRFWNILSYWMRKDYWNQIEKRMK